MSSSESPVAGAHQPVDRQPGRGAALPVVLADVVRALAAAPADADDAALLAIVGKATVPALGDVVALYAGEGVGGTRLIGVAPVDAPAARRLQDAVVQHPGAVAQYAVVAAGGDGAAIMSGEGIEAGRSLRHAAGLNAEIVAPLGEAGSRDGLLVFGVFDASRRYDEADRSTAEVVAALMTARRAASRQAAGEVSLRQQLDALAMAGRELAHALNNDLTMPVGVIELLMDRSGFSPDLQEMLQAASKDLEALEQHVREFHELMRTQSGASTS